MNLYLGDHFEAEADRVVEANIAMGVGAAGEGKAPANSIILTIVNYREEKTLKNLPNYTRHDDTMRVTYENQPIYLHFMLLISMTHNEYKTSLLDLSRVFRFFQSRNVFNQDNVAPDSLNPDGTDELTIDQLETFKIVVDLYTPSFEEINHMWGTLGGKQYPFALYNVRMLDLKFRTIQRESGLITKVKTEFSHLNSR